MIEITHPDINHYIESLYRETDPVLLEMEKYGNAKNFPYVGPQVGRLLFLLTRLLKAERVLEMGSGFGYSAYWFAKALPVAGKVFQTEFSVENSLKAREFFKKGDLSDRSEFLVGDCLELIDQTAGLFDIIFLDLEKEDYPAAFEKACGRLKKGGLLLADNTLWFGRVLEPDPREDTTGILEFTKRLFRHRDFFATIAPIRDGVAIGYKHG